jgi:hypothetical protein
MGRPTATKGAPVARTAGGPLPGPTAFDEAGFVLDRFWLNGQQVDAKHVSAAEVEAWARAVEDGEGRRGYPMPVVSVHGLVNGILLSDHRGLAADLLGRLRNVPPAFRDRAAGDSVGPTAHIPMSWPPPLSAGTGCCSTAWRPSTCGHCLPHGSQPMMPTGPMRNGWTYGSD